ncbi:transposase [Desulfuromonas sp. DDH964]|uniref:transposase n=1 Tax=Desulfuromonas sp. DDH964 TaxID=1823759 RepID=UPI0009EE58C1
MVSLGCIPRPFYSDEFRQEAVSLVVNGGLTVAKVSRRLSVSQQTLRNWIKKYRSKGQISFGNRSVSDLVVEVSRLRKELAETAV